MGRIETWDDVPFSVTADCSEQVLRKDLPMWIGKSDSLDKKIAEFLQTDKFTSGWVFHSDGEEKILVLPEIKEGTDFIEIEIKGTSSGYYDPGSWGGPNDSASAPESDDEREVDSAEIFLYDKEGDLIHQFETQDGEVLATLEDILMTEIAEADIN